MCSIIAACSRVVSDVALGTGAGGPAMLIPPPPAVSKNRAIAASMFAPAISRPHFGAASEQHQEVHQRDLPRASLRHAESADLLSSAALKSTSLAIFNAVPIRSLRRREAPSDLFAAKAVILNDLDLCASRLGPLEVPGPLQRDGSILI